MNISSWRRGWCGNPFYTALEEIKNNEIEFTFAQSGEEALNVLHKAHSANRTDTFRY